MSDHFVDFLWGGLVGLTAWFFGGLDGFIKVLIALSVVDYCSGVAAAWVHHKISSRIGFNGILKKSVMFALVGVANLIDNQFLSGADTVRTAVILFFVSNEGFSIMENAHSLGVPFPDALKNRLLQFSKNQDEHTALPSDNSQNNELKHNDKKP